MASGNGSEIIEYREKIMTALLNDKPLCEYVLNQTITILDDDIQVVLKKNNIYNFPYVPDVQEQAKTYITFDIDGENSNRTNLYKDMSLYFWIFAHKSIIQDDDGNLRTDLIDERVQYLFNDNEDFGIGKMYLSKDKMLSVGENFCGRRLVFITKDLNKANCR